MARSPVIRQRSFAGGELSPSLHGADDLPIYGQAAAALRNLVSSKLRTARPRPGLPYCGAVKDHAKRARLIPFDFSDDQAYALELGERYMRIWLDGAPLLDAGHMIVGGAAGAARVSASGSAWASAAIGDGRTYRAAASSDTTTIAAASDGKVARRARPAPLQPAAWQVGIAVDEYPEVVDWQGVATNGKTWVLVGGAYAAVSRDDGLTWSRWYIGGAQTSLLEVCWTGSEWIAVGAEAGDGIVFASKDGDTWTVRRLYGGQNASLTGQQMRGVVALAPAELVAVGGNSAGSVSAIWRSGDAGATWSSIAHANGPSLFYACAARGDVVVAVGSNAIHTSADRGATWTRTHAPVYAIVDVDASRTGFVAIGSQPYAHVAGTDGLAWTQYGTGGAAGQAAIVPALGEGPVIEVATPYRLDDVARLTRAQSGDVLTLFHRGYSPREVRRYGLYDWRLLDWYDPSLIPIGVPAGIGWEAGFAPDFAGDETHPPLAWQWAVTYEDEHGRESRPSAAFAPGAVVCYPDRPVELAWTAVAGARRYMVYRALPGGEFSWVGTSLEPKFRDAGREPLVTLNPPYWTNPYASDLSFPACGTYFDDRMATGGSTVGPSEVRASALGDYKNFDEHLVSDEADAVRFQLLARRYEEIRWIVPLERMIVGTSESDWVVGGSGDAPLQFDSVFARARHARGVAPIEPLVIGKRILYVQKGGQVVRELDLEGEGDEVSLAAEHLLADANRRIVEWAYARGVVWCVCDDGALLALAYHPESKVAAWSRCDSDGDAFESVCAIPEDDVETAYFIVRRTVGAQTKRYVERTALPATAIADHVQFDSAVTALGAGLAAVAGLAHLEGRTVGIVADGTYRGTAVVAGGQVAIPGAPAAKAHAGLPMVCDFESLDLAEARTGQKSVQSAALEFRVQPATADPQAAVLLGQTLATIASGGDRRLADAPDGLLQVPIDSGWNQGARVAFRLTQPVPLEIRGISREVSR